MQIGISVGIGQHQSVAGGAFDPSPLFAGGIGGDPFIPNRDWAYTKTGGGVYEKVTTTGDLVARVTGMVNGINADQDVEASRPAYGESGGLSWLQHDGSDDFLVTPSINLTGTDKVAVFCGVRKSSDAAVGALAEFGTNWGVTGNAFAVFAPGTAGATYGVRSKGAGGVGAIINTGDAYAAPTSNVLSGIFNITTDVGLLRINGAQVGSSSDDQGTGNYGNYPLYVGRRAGTTLPFNGRIYGLMVLGKTPSAAEIAATEAWLSRLSGVTL